MVTISTGEPWGDIRAQIRAVCDKGHPKDACFIANSGTLTEQTKLPKEMNLPKRVLMHQRDEGILITTNEKKLQIFKMPVLTDRDLAIILDYPQTKADVMKEGACAVIQAKDEEGNVIHDFVIGLSKMMWGIDHIKDYIPRGGKLVITTIFEAHARRRILTDQEDKR